MRDANYETLCPLWVQGLCSGSGIQAGSLQRMVEKDQMKNTSKMTLIEALEDLYLQATTEKSHFYTANLLKAAIKEIKRLQRIEHEWLRERGRA